jgi:hypothetical protein
MRYLMDAMPTLALLSIFGFWQGFSTQIKKPVRLKFYTVFGLTLLIISILFGILLAFSSDAQRIRTNNPALLNHLRLFFIQIMNRLVK